MHAVSHSLSHRGPNATRARARWQPYSAVTLSSSNAPTSRTPSVAYLHTPASSVSSSPPNVALSSASDSITLKAHSLPTTTGLARDPSKTKYATRLVDQAVRSLCDTWHPDDIPPVFNSPSCSSAVEPVVTQRDGRSCAINPSLFSGRNIQLPSPISPSTQSSPSPFLPGPPESFGRSSVCASFSHQLLPIKGFVHEVLRRSRTSVGVLQTALCYLEAVRTKVPALIEKAKANETSTESEYAKPDAQDIQGQLMACDDLLHEFETSTGAAAVSRSDPSETDTVRVSDDAVSMPATPASLYEYDSGQGPTHPPSSSKPRQSPALPPLPPLPSPLLCPRRTFLACLILASKFMQDRSYSNRAWAKLAGLHPREIGRCERAVGNVLEWRLWVGKDLPTPNSTRRVTRSKSDGDLMHRLLSSSATEGTATPSNASSHVGGDGYPYMDGFVAPVPTPTQTPRISTRNGLRRYATVSDIQTGTSSGFLDTNPSSPESLAASSVYEGYATPLTSNMVSDIGPMGFSEGELGVSPTSTSTPTMLYSPTSTSSMSSEGVDDGTVQMTFSDVPPPFPASYTPLSLTSSGIPADFDLNLYIKSVMSIPDSTFDTEIRLAAFNPVASGYALYNLPSLSEAFQLGTF